MTKIKYTKNYNEIFNIKKNFYDDNKKNYKKIIKVNKRYIKQPLRKKCKICLNKLAKKIFYQHLINYTICKKCGHLNGLHEDTLKFTKWLYEDRKGKNYSSGYTKNFDKRVKNIYLPKVNFLKSTIKGKIKLLDVGSGAGHFLKALEIKKINSLGLEPNETLVNLGNKKLKKNILLKTDEKYFKNKILEKNNYNVMSLIAVLEHLNDPHSILKSFLKSKIKYLYISVPLFSLSTFLENSFQKIFPRHLGGAHTHLFTEQSINYLKKKYKLKSVGEWWFGTDFPDLYRSILNSSTYFKNQYVDHLDKNLFSVINELQNVLDKNKICSEVHLILKK